MAKSNNPFLKRANEQHEYTTEQILELERCTNDAEYFIDKYCQIQHAVHGSIRFELRPYQKRIVKTFANNRLSIALAPRQIGKSWIAGAFLLWFAMFHFEKTVVIASNKNDNAMEMIHRVRFIYERVPHWLKPGLPEDGWNKHSVGFDNGSRIISQATSENTGRGLAISLLFLDEFAFVRDSIAEEFWTSVSPTLATGGSCIISSTPNGDQDLFATLWREAESLLNGFKTVFAPWSEHPERDEAYKIEMTAKVGELMFRQEYNCEFISSDPLLINTLKLNTMKGVPPLFEDEGIKYWDTIDARKSYLIGVDVSEGLGKDFGTIQLFDDRLKQVAEFRNNKLSEAKLYDKLKVLIKYVLKHKFNGKPPTLMWSFENNACGKVISTLYYNDAKFPEEAELISVGEKLGMNTNMSSKAEACKDLKRLIEQANGMTIRSAEMISELKNYAQKGRGGTYEAKPGATDDLISGTLIVTRLFKYITSYDDDAFNRLYRGDEHEGQAEDDGSIEPMPLGFL